MNGAANTTKSLPETTYCLGSTPWWRNTHAERCPATSRDAEILGRPGAWSMGWLCDATGEGLQPAAVA